MRSPALSACAIFALGFACVLATACNGSSPFGSGSGVVTNPITSPTPTPVTNGSSTAPVSLMISDPAACKAPNGPFTHLYISIADIKASTNADAAPGDPGFVDLTPGLSSTPQQVDLLGQADSHCFLASLGVGTQIALGNYQQIRIFLVPDSKASSVPNNACGASYANCIVRSDNSLYDLQLAPATAQGIEISTSQIVNSGFNVEANSSPTVDIDFDTCSSILALQGGGYEFNPVVHAGVIPSSGSTITGTVVSSKTGQSLQGGQVVVALEQKDPITGVDRILMRTTASSSGSFVLCPVPTGTYDLVAVGVDGAGISYSAGVEEGIQSGQTASEIPLVPGSAQGTLAGLVTTQAAGQPPSGVSSAVQANALQQIANGVTIVVPLLPEQNSFNAASLTGTAENCPPGADCSQFSLQLPATAPNVVACSQNTAQFQQQQGLATYVAESFAQVPGSGGTPQCSASYLNAASTPQGGSIVLNPDQSTTAANMSYTQCQ